MDINILFLNIFALLFAVTVHEVAHGLVAYWGGDPTAKLAGRLTLNPLKHIDPVGSVLVPGVLALIGAPVFGWAKPVPVRVGLLRNPRRDGALVSAAGVAANLGLALICGIVARLVFQLYSPGDASFVNGLLEEIIQLMRLSVLINCILFVLNLTPLPPADGGHLLMYLLPPKQGMALERARLYTMMALIMLLATGVLGKIIWGVVRPMSGIILGPELAFF